MRIMCIVAYDGTEFNGYQKQPGQRTVQGAIEAALAKICKVQVGIHSSGRTDSGVHARGQVFHFDSDMNMEGSRYRNALNAILPADIYVLESRQVHEQFHARYHGKIKEYQYHLSLNEYDPLKRNYVYYHRVKLDIAKMTEAMQYFLGTHDFTSFCGNLEKTDKVRTIYEVELLNDQGELTFRFVGNGFLKHMIRIMIGTLIQIGEGKRQPEAINAIIKGKKRELAGHTAKPQGLYLEYVKYPQKLLNTSNKKDEITKTM